MVWISKTNDMPQMIVYKYVSPKIMTFLVQKWPHKNESINLRNIIKIPKNQNILSVIFQISYNIQKVSTFYLQSNLEGILNF
jgi:hypothetical protein